MNLKLLAVLKNQTAQAIAASQTAVVVTDEFRIDSLAAVLGLRVSIKCSAITVAAGISAKLQLSVLGGESADYEDFDGTNAKVSLTGTSHWVDIPVAPSNSNYTSKFPLRQFGRIVVTTGAGDSVTVSDVRVTIPD